jgi:glycosyltransferase involved in cell wall biosynthesis
VPFVITFHHGGHSSALRNAIRSLQWVALVPLMRRASHYIGVSQYEIDFFKAKLRKPASHFSLIPNGAALPCPVHPLPQKDGLRWIVSPGRLEKYKGHQRVIAAMPALLKRDPNVRLRIAGAGLYEAQLHQQAAQLGVAGQVVIKGISASDRSGMAELLMQADLVTLLSDCESHPIGVMEAVALKRSVLVADNSGLRELAQKGYAKVVSLALPPAKLADVIHQQMLHPLVPPDIDIASWDDCVQGVLNVYQRVLAQQGALCAS